MKDFLTLKHYKEPLLPVDKKKGYGYFGAIQVTIDGQKIQCHKCGELFSDLSGHIRGSHNLSLDKYRETYRLSRTTALISEAEREKRKMRTITWLASLSESEKAKMKEKAKKNFLKWKKSQVEGKWKERLEAKNRKGSCPDQILSKIQEVAKTLGHTPSLREFIEVTGGQRYKHLVYKVYGSWDNALKILGIYKKKSTAHAKVRRYSDEELLESLSIFAQENRKIPTATDSKRGLIPDYYTYIRRFGSFDRARELAGVDKFI